MSRLRTVLHTQMLCLESLTYVLSFNVDIQKMIEIFRNPRIAAGYTDNMKKGHVFAIGDQVQVIGCGRRGLGTLTDLQDYSGKMRVRITRYFFDAFILYLLF